MRHNWNLNKSQHVIEFKVLTSIRQKQYGFSFFLYCIFGVYDLTIPEKKLKPEMTYRASKVDLIILE